MSSRFPFERLADVRQDAQLLTERAGAHEQHAAPPQLLADLRDGYPARAPRPVGACLARVERSALTKITSDA
jgi:hypothetical protein